MIATLGALLIVLITLLWTYHPCLNCADRILKAFVLMVTLGAAR